MEEEKNEKHIILQPPENIEENIEEPFNERKESDDPENQIEEDVESPLQIESEKNPTDELQDVLENNFQKKISDAYQNAKTLMQAGYFHDAMESYKEFFELVYEIFASDPEDSISIYEVIFSLRSLSKYYRLIGDLKKSNALITFIQQLIPHSQNGRPCLSIYKQIIDTLNGVDVQIQNPQSTASFALLSLPKASEMKPEVKEQPKDKKEEAKTIISDYWKRAIISFVLTILAILSVAIFVLMRYVSRNNLQNEYLEVLNRFDRKTLGSDDIEKVAQEYRDIY